jgi:hypothetical protein
MVISFREEGGGVIILVRKDGKRKEFTLMIYACKGTKICASLGKEMSFAC